jgi:hypothetical protein
MVSQIYASQLALRLSVSVSKFPPAQTAVKPVKFTVMAFAITQMAQQLNVGCAHAVCFGFLTIL